MVEFTIISIAGTGDCRKCAESLRRFLERERPEKEKERVLYEKEHMETGS